MLSKSQAKSFFLLGTAVCTAAFVGLTIDTFQRIPNQTRQAELSESAIRGKHLFEKNNCMGCHTIFGEGAYYAPELTKVFERRGESFIRGILKNPEAMYPGDRKMTNYHFNDEQISDLVTFFKWVGQVDLNGFPPKPDLMAGSSAAKAMDVSATGGVARPVLFNQMCTACHSLSGAGGNVGPALDGVGGRREASYLRQWLENPQSIKADSKMPKLPLSELEINELTQFLSQLKGG